MHSKTGTAASDRHMLGMNRRSLITRGREVEALPDWTATVGGGQGIAFDTEERSFMGGADPRRDG